MRGYNGNIGSLKTHSPITKTFQAALWNKPKGSLKRLSKPNSAAPTHAPNQPHPTHHPLPAHGLPASRKNAGQPFQAANIFARVHYDAAFVCFQAAFGLHRKRQPETFAKPVTDSPSAARRHLANQQSPLNTHLATSRRCSIAHLIFRLPLSKQRQPENHPQHKKHFRLPYGTNPKAA